MTRNTKAFTLLELLLTVAVLAVLAAILFPVTATARQGGVRSATGTNLRLIGMAANQYAVDYDTQVVRTQQSGVDADKIWSVALSAYLPDRTRFFDPTRTVPATPTVSVLPGTVLPWYRVVSLSINDGGYTGRWMTQGNRCDGRRIGYQFGGRSTATMVDPGKRVAFAPTTWGGTKVGWYAFHNYDASWINTTVLGSVFSWNNMVYNTRTLYANSTIPVVHADGSAGTLTRADFVDTTQAKTLASYCSWMTTTGAKRWGSFWTQD